MAEIKIVKDYFKPSSRFNSCDHCKYMVDRRDIDFPCSDCSHNANNETRLRIQNMKKEGGA
jgi:hypothetical protein